MYHAEFLGLDFILCILFCHGPSYQGYVEALMQKEIIRILLG